MFRSMLEAVCLKYSQHWIAICTGGSKFLYLLAAAAMIYNYSNNQQQQQHSRSIPPRPNTLTLSYHNAKIFWELSLLNLFCDIRVSKWCQNFRFNLIVWKDLCEEIMIKTFLKDTRVSKYQQNFNFYMKSRHADPSVPLLHPVSQAICGLLIQCINDELVAESLTREAALCSQM